MWGLQLEVWGAAPLVNVDDFIAYGRWVKRIGSVTVECEAFRDGPRYDPEVVAVDRNHLFLILNHLEGISKTWL